MATSGNFLTSDSGQGGGNFYGRMIFEWWVTSSGYSGNVGYHNISYHLKTYGGTPGSYQYFYQGSMNVDGAGYSWGTTKAYGAGATVFGDYSKTLYTDSAGNRSFGASAQGGVYYNTINTSGSSGWALPNIPLYATLTALSTDAGGIVAYDEGPLWLEFSNPSGTNVTSFVESPPGGVRIWTNSGSGSRHNFSFSPDRIQALQQSSPNSNSFPIRIGIYDSVTGSVHYDYRDRTMYIKNDLGQANPNFSTFTYQDTNGTTSTVTGDNQVLIQGKSTLSVTVPVANAATPNKFANMSSYLFSIGSYSASDPYSAVSNVVRAVGTVGDVTGVQNISVRALDSRGNGKTATTPVTILPYTSPFFVPSLTVRYTNDYDNTSGITLTTSGSNIATISPLTLSGTDKNSVNSTSGIQFDVSKGNNTSYTGTWVNVANARTAGSSDVTATYATVASSILTKMNGVGADNTVKWYVKFKIVDALETQYYETTIDIGKTIFRIGVDGNVYNNEERIPTEADLTGVNPYKFSAYLTTNQSTGSGGFFLLDMSTELYDTNSNYDTTNKRYTAPIDGYYQFTATYLCQSQAGSPKLLSLGKNGTSETYRLMEIPNTTGNITMSGSIEIYLDAGDTICALGYSVESKTLLGGMQYSRFSGRLVSK